MKIIIENVHRQCDIIINKIPTEIVIGVSLRIFKILFISFLNEGLLNFASISPIDFKSHIAIVLNSFLTMGKGSLKIRTIRYGNLINVQ